MEEEYDKWLSAVQEINPYMHDNDSSYDMREAFKANMMPAKEDGHMGSRNPYNGKLLKSEEHPTFNKMIQAEVAMGYEIIEMYDENSIRANGKSLYSIDPEEMDSTLKFPYDKLFDPNKIIDIENPKAEDESFMTEAIVWNNEHPFSSEIYANFEFDNRTDRSAHIRRLRPDNYMNFLQEEGNSVQRKRIFTNVIEPSLKNQFVKDIELHGAEKALKMPSSVKYFEITGKIIGL